MDTAHTELNIQTAAYSLALSEGDPTYLVFVYDFQAQCLQSVQTGVAEWPRTEILGRLSSLQSLRATVTSGSVSQMEVTVAVLGDGRSGTCGTAGNVSWGSNLDHHSALTNFAVSTLADGPVHQGGADCLVDSRTPW